MMIFAAYRASLADAQALLEDERPTIGGSYLEAEGEPLVNPLSLSNDERRALLEQIDSREVMALRAVVRMFADKPNKNRSRPEPGRLEELAGAARGADYVRNHSRGVEDVAGSILAAEVRTFEGSEALVGLHRITEPTEMAAFVRGERTKFSVAIGAERWECSECSEQGLVAPFGTFFACEHHNASSGAELFGRGQLQFLHNAAVTNPAVSGTRILDLADTNDHAGAWERARSCSLHALNSQPVGMSQPPGKEKSSFTEGAYQAPEPEGDMMTLEEMQALLDAERAKTASLEAEKATEAQAYADRLAASETARLDTLLDGAVASFCITPAEREHFHALREGGQMELAEKMLKARQPLASTPTQPQGIDQSLTSQAPQTNPQATQWSASEAIAAQGLLPKHVLDKLKEGGSIIHPKLLQRTSAL
jgi:hypothetical protein